MTTTKTKPAYPIEPRHRAAFRAARKATLVEIRAELGRIGVSYSEERENPCSSVIARRLGSKVVLQDDQVTTTGDGRHVLAWLRLIPAEGTSAIDGYRWFWAASGEWEG